MKFGRSVPFLAIVCLVGFSAGLMGAEANSGNWPNWRGPHFNGTSLDATPPTTWDEEKNVQWKVALPGKGSSSPIIWEDKLFLLTAVPVPVPVSETPEEPAEPPAEADPQPSQRGPGDSPRRGGRGRGGFGRGEAPQTPIEFTVLCFENVTGDLLWKQVATKEVPHEAGHNTNTFASASAVTDGELLIAFFGSRGVFCYDLKGKLLWERDLGDQQTRSAFGEGSTPALYQNTLIVPWDHEGESFVAALDAKTGKDLWKIPRDEATTWATPVVAEHEGAAQVILNGSTKVRSYDVKSGELLWECGGQATNPIPTPIIYNGTAICMTGYRGYAIYAVKLDARGDVTENEEAIAWSRTDVGPYIASATVVDNQLYVTKSRDGILYCLDARTGETIFGPERLPDSSTLYASLVAADGKVYISDRDGTTVVLQAGPEYQVLAVNQLAEGIDASFALVGSQIFVRTENHLYCLEEMDKN